MISRELEITAPSQVFHGLLRAMHSALEWHILITMGSSGVPREKEEQEGQLASCQFHLLVL